MTEPMTNDERIAALEAEIAALKKAAAAPPKPFVAQPMEKYDWTERATMPPGVLAEMVAAVPLGVLRDVVRDFRGGPSAPRSQAEATKKSVGTAGWSEAVPLGPPPGQKLIEGMVDVQDAADKLARARRLAGEGDE